MGKTKEKVTVKGTKKELIAGLDVGTSKVLAIVGRARGDGLEILGSSVTSSDGVAKGTITNIDKVCERIRKVVRRLLPRRTVLETSGLRA